MTDVRSGPPRPADEPAGVVATRAHHQPGHRRGGPGGGGPSRRWMAGFLTALGVIVLLGAGLAYVGLSTVRTSRAGRVISTITDPAAPGFEALVEPSPTLVVLDVGPEGWLRSLVVVSLNPGDQGGAVFLVAPTTHAGAADSPLLGTVYAYAAQHEDTRVAAQDVVTMGINEATTVDAARWEELIAPVAPLTIENPVDLPGFPAGTISLGADQVDAWLNATNAGDTELDRLQQHQLLWTAWIAAVGQSTDPAVVPGEVDSGIGRFVRGLAHGPTRIDAVPTTESTTATGAIEYVPDLDAMRALVNERVPFPTGSAVQPRVRVRVLDGTGDQQHVSRIAPLIIPAGAEIVVAGNADSFDHTTTEVRFHNPQVRPQAEALLAALGAGELVEDPRPTDAFDVTIVLGSDA